MKTREYKITQFISHFVLIIFTVLAAAPFILLVISSFTDESWAVANGYSFFPEKFSLDAYKFIAYQSSDIVRAYFMTIASTIVGTTISLCISVLFAYAICQSYVPGMKVISFLLIFTMLFNGGLVSTYYCYVKLYGIKDTFWALVIPGLLMSPFEVVLLRNYFKTSIPSGLLEAARLDGAKEFCILHKIVLPLSKPIVVTVTLMRGLAYWNDWTNGLYYLSDRGGKKYFTIQTVMNNMVESLETLRTTALNGIVDGKAIMAMPSTTVRMALAAIGVLPIMVVYPFFLRYFVKGITLGGVKE